MTYRQLLEQFDDTELDSETVCPGLDPDGDGIDSYTIREVDRNPDAIQLLWLQVSGDNSIVEVHHGSD